MLKAIFSKTTLMLLIVLFMVLWLGGEVLSRFVHLPGAQSETPSAPIEQTITIPEEPDPAVVTAITHAVQPIADELRHSMDEWWADQKVKLAQQASQWFSQQEQLLLDVLKVKLQEWVNQTLGISTASVQ